MIVVFTEYASRSDRIERQLESAFNSGVTIIPFRTEPAAIGNLSESPLDSVHWLDALTPEMRTRLRSLGDLVRSLRSRKRNDPPVPNTSTIAERIGRKARQTSKTGAVKALLLTVTPFLLVLGVGFWRTKNDLKSGLPKPKRAMTTPTGKKAADRGEIEYVEYAAWDPDWGTPDANWSIVGLFRSPKPKTQP